MELKPLISGFAKTAILGLIFSFSLGARAITSSNENPLTLTSPDGKIQAEIKVENGTLCYRIAAEGKQILAPSRLGILSDDTDLGKDVSLGKPEVHAVHEEYRFYGSHAIARNDAREASIPATSHGENYTIDVHVANDGVGIRLRLSAKAGRRVQADRSTWVLEGNPAIWADQLDPAYESHYRTTSLQDLGSDLLGLPLTAKVGNLYVTLSEAALKDYGDLAVKRGSSGALEGQLYADPDGWTTNNAVIQPWRVTIVAHTLTELVNSTLVQNLNPPADQKLVRASWIQPGRSTWQWMAIGAPKEDDQEQWIDWTQELGFEYYLVDDGWAAWKDPWTSLAAVSSYAKTKKVKVWLWVHSNQVKSPEARRMYFRKAAEAGIAGIKVDFPAACNREWSKWYYDVARDAAEFKLMVDFHGANKPTGMERTWPNVLTREGVRGHEWHMTRYKRVLEPAHDTILPFTRFVAGPGDYTPTVFDKKELQGNTWAHELAQAVVFTSPFLCLSGNPKDYLENPAKDVLSAIPAVWDETRVLGGSEPGKVVAMARRVGNQWFLAVINGGAETTLDIHLTFLGKGEWKSRQLFDNNEKPDAWSEKSGNITQNDHIRLTLLPRGGFVAWLHP